MRNPSCKLTRWIWLIRLILTCNFHAARCLLDSNSGALSFRLLCCTCHTANACRAAGAMEVWKIRDSKNQNGKSEAKAVSKKSRKNSRFYTIQLFNPIHIILQILSRYKSPKPRPMPRHRWLPPKKEGWKHSGRQRTAKAKGSLEHSTIPRAGNKPVGPGKPSIKVLEISRNCKLTHQTRLKSRVTPKSANTSKLRHPKDVFKVFPVSSYLQLHTPLFGRLQLHQKPFTNEKHTEDICIYPPWN